MVYTGLSGNEIFCLAQKGLMPGDIIIGNSVYSMGFVGGLQSGFRGFVGGEISQFTQMIAEGRNASLQRLEKEVRDKSGIGVTGVTSELVFHAGNIEFLSVGSMLHSTNSSQEKFTSSADGQELYCQIDASYHPRSFVFGNVAYSIGVGKGLMGSIKQLARGEVREYSDIFNTTRHLALTRIQDEARKAGANSVVGIKTTILPFAAAGIQEMVMIGTGSTYQNLPQEYSDQIITSDLTCEEMWNMTNMGYMPVQLLLGTSVYSLGFAGGIGSALKSLVKGEINQLTSLIYDARENSLGKIKSQAESLGVDDVIGIKTYVYELGSGLIEFLAIGTGVKKIQGATTESTQLLPQAIIKDKDTFYNRAEMSFGVDLNR